MLILAEEPFIEEMSGFTYWNDNSLNAFIKKVSGTSSQNIMRST